MTKSQYKDVCVCGEKYRERSPECSTDMKRYLLHTVKHDLYIPACVGALRKWVIWCAAL